MADSVCSVQIVSDTSDNNTSENTPDIVMYWRPGCGFCAALERRMDKAELVFEKRNIWEDPEHAAFVRSVARGNETVPTLVVKGTAMVNPSLEQVVEALL
jgi:mycoredoxin